MLFNSFSFLAAFGVLALLYYALPHRFRWPLLLAASLGFYATFELSHVLLLLIVTLVTFVAGLAIERAPTRGTRRVRLLLGLAAPLGALGALKYYGFVVTTVEGLVGSATPVFPRLPVVAVAGLSFYAFSCIAYLADVYAGRMVAERSLGPFTLYVAFFPKLLAGPIERAQSLLAQFRQPVRFDASAVTSGLQLVLWGLFKKVVIADRLAVFVDDAYRQPGFAPPADLLLATYFFAFQLYCDFSGYSDAAIGMARVLGFDLGLNFKRPYLATSVREFWSQRWHLSLSAWFRDYLYIPLGGSRGSSVRTALNLMVVFALSGLWHGAQWTFVVWGALNGSYQVVSLVTQRARARLVAAAPAPAPEWMGRWARRALTFHLVLVTWVFFRATSLDDASTILARLWASAAALPSGLFARLESGEIALSIALIIVLMGVETADERAPIWERARRWPTAVRWALYYALLFSLIVLGSWKLQQFVYMQF